MRPEIAIEGDRRLLRLRQRHIAIRSHQVEPVSMKTGALHHRLPRNFMERQMAASAECADLWRGGTIDMHLPFERRQRLEVVCFPGRRGEAHPRQAIAAVDVSGAAFTQSTPAIMDGRL